MNDQAPLLRDPADQQLWTRYFAEVDRCLRPMPPGRSADIREELVNHVLDALEAPAAEGCAPSLNDVFARLGAPSSYLGQPQEPDEWTVSSAREQVRRGLADLLRSILLGASYLVGFLALALAVSKPLYPDYVGLFRLAEGWWIAGYVDSQGAREMLGFWIIPLMLGVVFLCWFSLPRRLH
ncbi:MAG: hypothetical protein AAGA23_06520 [Pseudomonadota bacterium]